MKKKAFEIPQFNNCTSPKASSTLHFGAKMAFVFNELNEVKALLEEEEGEKMEDLLDRVQDQKNSNGNPSVSPAPLGQAVVSRH